MYVGLNPSSASHDMGCRAPNVSVPRFPLLFIETQPPFCCVLARIP